MRKMYIFFFSLRFFHFSAFASGSPYERRASTGRKLAQCKIRCIRMQEQLLHRKDRKYIFPGIAKTFLPVEEYQHKVSTENFTQNWTLD